MELLPAEMLETIFSNLRSETLIKVISRVCQGWATTARRIVDRRLEEMQRYFPPHDPLEISCLISPSVRDDPLEILFAYEQVFLRKYYHLEHKYALATRRNCMTDFLQKVISDRGCDCGDLSSCLVRSIHFMPCHQLLLVQVPERIDFYSVSEVLQGTENITKYSTEVKESRFSNVWIDNNTHTAVSVYKEFIVSQETTRALILFKVAEVNHESKSIILENVRRIFLPFWSCALIFMENKICALFTTGRVGVWSMTEDKIVVSNNTCVDLQVLRTMRESKLYKCNDLVLVKIVSESEPEVSWTVFDACAIETELNFIPFEFCRIFDALCLNRAECKNVNDAYFNSNMLVAHCDVSDPLEAEVICGQIFVKRLNRPLRIADFQDAASFINAIEEDKELNMGPMKCPVKLSVPFPVSLNELTDEPIAWCFIGFGRKTKIKSKHHCDYLTKSVSSVRFDVMNKS